MSEVLTAEEAIAKVEDHIIKPRFTFKSWYETNKARLSKERRLKYHTDPEYKSKLRDQAIIYRANRPKVARVKKEKEHMTVLMLCEKAGCSIHTYRKYCHQKWIPILDGKLIFTDKHVALLANLCKEAKETKYLRDVREERLAPFIKALQQGWK